MGWAEQMAMRARDAAQSDADRIAELPREPGEQDLGAAPSPWLDEIARRMQRDCMSMAGQIQAAARPNLSLAGGPRLDFTATMLNGLIISLHAQAATIDLLLTFLNGRPELRPVQPAKSAEVPGNGKAQEQEAEKG
jgi:hypothetical protein